MADQVAVGGQVVVAPVPTAGTADRRQVHKSKLFTFGIFEVVLGGFAFVLWLTSIMMAVTAPPKCYTSHSYYPTYKTHVSCYRGSYPFTYISSGLWCGMFLFISGSLGICARKKPSPCMYTANMAMSIISAVMMGIMLIISSIGAAVEAYFYPAIMAPHILQTLVALAAMIVCILHSAYCCAATCCGSRQSHGRVTYAATPQQFVHLPTGQVMVAQGQHMPAQNYPVMTTGLPVVHQPGSTVPVAMMAPGAAAYQTTVASPPGVNMPVTSIPSQHGSPQAYPYPSNPPRYNGQKQ